MKECNVCHFQNEDSSEFCKDCGSKLDQPAAAAAPVAPAAPPAAPAEAAAAPAPTAPGQTTCPVCQTANEPGDSFCKSCGHSLTAPAPEVDATATAAGATGTAPEVTPPPPPPPVEVVAVTGPRLVIANDPGKGTAFALNKAQVTLGRTVEGNDISLPGDGFVSSRHALVSQEGNDFYIEDRGSTNGTYKLLQGKVKLQPGDVIKVGDTNLEFQV